MLYIQHVYRCDKTLRFTVSETLRIEWRIEPIAISSDSVPLQHDDLNIKI